MSENEKENVVGSPSEKRCPKCRTVKAAAEFYRVKSRSDGLASWCKQCSNQGRKYHKPSKKKPEYRIVAEKVLKEGKPVDCPSCGAEGVPSHKMRGLALPDGRVIWDCVTCRNTRNRSRAPDEPLSAEADKVLWGCQWCEEEKMVPADQADHLYCSPECQECAEAVQERTRENEAAAIHA